EPLGGVHGLLPNDTLGQVLDRALREVGGVHYDEDDLAFARALQPSLDVPRPVESALEVAPYRSDVRGLASTDVGDVSRVVPTAGRSTATWVPGTPAHSWQAVAASGTAIGRRGARNAAAALAMAAVELYLRPDLVQAARAEFVRARGDAGYRPLLQREVPPLDYRGPAAPGARGRRRAAAGSVRAGMARAPLREPLAVVRQGLVVQVVYAGVAAAAAAVAGQRPLRRHRARVAGVGRPRRTGRGRGRDRHAAMGARTVVTVQTFRAARSGPRHVESAPNVNRGTCASMPSALGTHRAMRAWRRLALVVLACAGLLPATPSRALDPEMRAAHYTVTRWSADDGLPHSQIHDIGQDPDGFLWVATWEGTARFDGLGFTPVRGLHEAAGGRLASRLVWRDDDGSM